MRFDQDDKEQDWQREEEVQWTKEQSKRDPRFDFAPFLGPEAENLDDRITDALDGKDLLDKDAYGEFSPDYIPRRGTPGERGRHEAPAADPEDEIVEEQFDDGIVTRRFTSDSMPPEEDKPDFREETRPRAPLPNEPPPRPKVVVAQPAPKVYVAPPAEYNNQEPSKGSGLKWIIALLISAVVVVGALILVTTVLPDVMGGGGTPTPANGDTLGGISHPTQAPTAAPTEPPAPTPPPVKTYVITVTAGSGGTVSPSGRVDVNEGGSVTFSITPNEGFALGQLLIDGSNVSVQSSYTFSDVRQDHSIYAVFQAVQQPPTEPPPPTVAPTDEPIPEPESTPEPPPPVEGGDVPGPEGME